MGSAPLYKDIAARVRERIRSGELAPGQPTPTDRELAAECGVGRATASRALDVLVQEGLVSPGNTRAGRRVRDTRVLTVHASRTEQMERRRSAGVDAWVTDVKEAGRTPGQTIDVSVVHASADIAEFLELEPGTPVAVRRRMRTMDGDPSNTADTYYPMEIAKEIPQILDPSDVSPGVLVLLADHGYITDSYVDLYRWRPPTPEETAALGLGQGVSVLIQSRTGYQEGRPIHVTRTVWPGNTVQLRLELSA